MVPGGEQQICEMDGETTDTFGGEHYWHCGEPGMITVEEKLLCEDHAGELGYGPQQEKYGFDPDDRLTATEGSKQMGIDNTTRRMQDPTYRALMLDGTSNPGGRPGMIEQQERDGQRQLMNSDRLPVRLNGSRGLNGGLQAVFEALGFTFGVPDPADPLFRPATLPPGWTRQGTNHAMWSYLLDEHGRRRVAIFYKAAWYDREAFMNLETLLSYAAAHVEEGAPLVLDEWATRDGMLEALREHADQWREYASNSARADDAKGEAEDKARTAKYEAAIAALIRETGNG